MALFSLHKVLGFNLAEYFCVEIAYFLYVSLGSLQKVWVPPNIQNCSVVRVICRLGLQLSSVYLMGYYLLSVYLYLFLSGCRNSPSAIQLEIGS